MEICVRKLHHYRCRQWLVAEQATSHYLNQCWNIVNWTLRNKLQWNLNPNSYIFIQENAFENSVCEMAAICFGLNMLLLQWNFDQHSKVCFSGDAFQNVSAKCQPFYSFWPQWVNCISPGLSVCPHGGTRLALNLGDPPRNPNEVATRHNDANQLSLPHPGKSLCNMNENHIAKKIITAKNIYSTILKSRKF